MSFEDEALRALLPRAEREVQSLLPDVLRSMFIELGATPDEADKRAGALTRVHADKFLAAAEQYARNELRRHLTGWLVDASIGVGDALPMLQRLRDAGERTPQ